MTKKWLVSMLGAAAMTVSAGALAQGMGMAAVPSFYAGVEVGQSDLEGENDTGFKILGGYQFHRSIAAELSYGLLFDKGGAEATTIDLVAVGMFPVTPQLSILGKLGLAMWEVEFAGGKEDGTDLTWGLGAQYDLTRNLGLRLTWQRYEADEELDFISIGAIWRF